MKIITTFFLPALVLGGLIARLVFEGFGAGGALAAMVALVIAWLLVTLLNVSVFAPVYWLLGKSQKQVSGTKQPDHKA